jgi:hypothetical protein
MSGPTPPRPHRPTRLADDARGNTTFHAQNNWGIALAGQGKWQEALLHYPRLIAIGRA